MKTDIFLKVGGITFSLGGVSSLTYDQFCDTIKGAEQLTSSLDLIWATLKKECNDRGIIWKEDFIKTLPKNTDLDLPIEEEKATKKKKKGAK